MKRFLVLFLFLGLVMFYYGCSENNPSEPIFSQGDQVATSLSKVARFTSTSTIVGSIEAPTITPLPGGRTLAEGNNTQWRDEASDPRVTGNAFWNTNSRVNKYLSGKTWGTCELFVDGGGKWEITWDGVVEGSFANGDLYIKGVAKGVGVDGAVEGLTAKWFYILDQANVGFYYTSEGFIHEN